MGALTRQSEIALFRSANEEQAVKTLPGGRRWLARNFCWKGGWIEQDGCVDTRFFSNTVIVNLVGPPIHLWSVDLFKKGRKDTWWNVYEVVGYTIFPTC